jgi:hypothetical protein
MKTVKVNVEKTPKGFCASINLLPGLVVSVNGNILDLKKEVKDSIDFYIKCAKKDKEKYPKIFNGEYTLDYSFKNIGTALSLYKGLISLSALSVMSGINQRQLSHYQNGTSNPRKEQEEKIVFAMHELGKELQTVSSL